MTTRTHNLAAQADTSAAALESRRTRVIRGGCPHDCPDACAWLVTVENGVATKLQGDPHHPLTRGTLCAKVNHFLERVYSPDRVLHPLRRIGAKGEAKFEQVSWEVALDEIAARLKAIIARHGPTAILPYSFAGTAGLIQMLGMGSRFFARLGASRLERAICGETANQGVANTLGTSAGILPEQIAHSRYIILWGTNTLVTNLHLWPLIRQAKAKGATVVAIDPVKTRTAAAADWHLQPLPGTDAALALGLMRVIVDEGLDDADYVSRYTTGFDELRGRLADFPVERVAGLTGLTADDIRRLAHAYATTRPAVIRTLVGPEKHAQGAMAFRTIACLPALVGAWRDLGGGLLHWTIDLRTAALNLRGLAMPRLEDRSIRSFNMSQLGRALTDESLDPPIAALFVYSSNPAVIAPNQRLVHRGLSREDLFTVVHEQFLTETVRFADFVLPATTQIEHEDIIGSWGQNYVTLNEPAIAPLGEAISNSELFRRLATALGMADPFLHESDEAMIRNVLSSDHPYLGGITFDRLKNEGWAPLNLPADWRPFAEGGFKTPSGKCEFYSAKLAQRGLDPLPNYVPPEGADRYPLVLIAAKTALHFLNSSYVNLPRQRAAEVEPRLELHPDDAAARGIADGDLVRAFNDLGSITLRASVGDRVRSGVAAMPHGWSPSLSPTGASANALTSDGLSDQGGGSDMYDTRIEVERA
jgi:anaerobic selenocysteine-containing dehydrogenase